MESPPVDRLLLEPSSGLSLDDLRFENSSGLPGVDSNFLFNLAVNRGLPSSLVFGKEGVI